MIPGWWMLSEIVRKLDCWSYQVALEGPSRRNNRALRAVGTAPYDFSRAIVTVGYFQHRLEPVTRAVDAAAIP